MKKVTLFAIMALLVAFLAACGTTVAPKPDDNRQPTPVEKTNFFTVIDSEFDSERSWQYADHRSIDTVDAGDEIILVYGYTRGVYRVEITGWNTVAGVDLSFPSPKPFNFGDGEGVETHTVRLIEPGEYHFTLWLSNQGGDPLEDTPIERVVTVRGEEQDEDETPVEEEPATPDSGLSWFNITIDGRSVNDGDVVSNVDGVSFNWGFRSGTSNRVVRVSSQNGTARTSSSVDGSFWIPLSDLRGEVVFFTSYRYSGEDMEEEVRIRVQSSSNPNPSPTPEDLVDYMSYFNATRGSTTILNGADVRVTSSQGISFNWGIDSGVNVRVTVVNDGRTLVDSTRRNDSVWFGYSDLRNGETTFRVRITKGGQSYTQTLRFYVQKGSSGGGGTPTRGEVTFDLRDVSGVTLRVYDSNGYVVDDVRNGDRLTLSNGSYTARVVTSGVEVSRTSLACSRDNATRVSFWIQNNDRITCRVNLERTSSTQPPAGSNLSVVYLGNFYTSLVVVPLYGSNFEIRWDAPRNYDRYYIQLYKVGEADFFQSSDRTGSRTFSPAALGAGEYQFRLNKYVDGRNDVEIVTIRIQ